MRPLTAARDIAVAAALIGVAACSNKSQPMDESMKRDLAAVRAGPSQMVISPLEAGESSAPTPASRKRTPQARPVSHPTKQVESRVAQAPAREPQPVAAEAAPQATTQAVEPAPAPATARPTAPARGEDAHRGPYKTEAEIFRQMPWIRP